MVIRNIGNGLFASMNMNLFYYLKQKVPTFLQLGMILLNQKQSTVWIICTDLYALYFAVHAVN